MHLLCTLILKCSQFHAWHSPHSPASPRLCPQNWPSCFTSRKPFMDTMGWARWPCLGLQSYSVSVSSITKTFDWNPLFLCLCSLDSELFENRQRTFFFAFSASVRHIVGAQHLLSGCSSRRVQIIIRIGCLRKH